MRRHDDEIRAQVELHKRKHIPFLLHARPDSVLESFGFRREFPNLIATGIYAIGMTALAKKERKRHCDWFHSADRFRSIDGSLLLSYAM